MQNAQIAILSLGMLFVIVTGGIDLSVGSVVALSSTVLAIFLQGGLPLSVTILLTFCIAAGAGLINGFFVAYTRIPPLIVTLGSLSILRGAAYLFQIGYGRRLYNTTFEFFFAGTVQGVPIPVIYMLFLYLIADFVLRNTGFGKDLLAVGGNKVAAHVAGIPVRRRLLATYMICSMLASLTGIIISARLMMGNARIGQGYELDAIATVVLGGAALTGGKGSALNTLVAAFILGILTNILNLMGIAEYYQMVMKGAILIIAAMAQEVEWRWR